MKKKPQKTNTQRNSRKGDKESLKRLTIDVPADLHTAIKVSCAKRGIRMADEIRMLLKEKYQTSKSKQ